MTAEGDAENLGEEGGDQRIVDLALQAVYKGTRKHKLSLGKSKLERKRTSRVHRWQTCKSRRKELVAKGKRKVAREKIQHVTLAVKQHTLQRGVEKAAT